MINREKLLELNSSGLTQKQIATELNVSRATVQRAFKVLTKLYKNSTIYLQRKYDRIAVLSSNW